MELFGKQIGDQKQKIQSLESKIKMMDQNRDVGQFAKEIGKKFLDLLSCL